jgi:branched-chain amino acid transport system substrate-binding protein
MSKETKFYVIASALCASVAAAAARAETNKVVIGDIDDMSGVHADIIGPGGMTLPK